MIIKKYSNLFVGSLYGLPALSFFCLNSTLLYSSNNFLDKDFDKIVTTYAKQEKDAKWCDLYGKRPGTKPHFISFEALEINYLENKQRKKVCKERTVFEQEFDNLKSSNDQSILIKRTESTQSTYSWTMTKLLKTSNTTFGELDLKIPLIIELGKATSQVNVEFDLTSTKTKTENRTRTWEIDQTLKIPANKVSIFSYIIEEMEGEIPFVLPIKVTGDFCYQRKKGKSVEHSPIAEVFKHRSYEGYKVEGEAVIFTAEGILKKVDGIKSKISVQEYSQGEFDSLKDSQNHNISALKENSLQEKSTGKELSADITTGNGKSLPQPGLSSNSDFNFVTPGGKSPINKRPRGRIVYLTEKDTFTEKDVVKSEEWKRKTQVIEKKGNPLTNSLSWKSVRYSGASAHPTVNASNNKKEPKGRDRYSTSKNLG